MGISEVQRLFEEQLEAVAKSEVTVLLSGESGSGKGVAARRLHELSARAQGPFLGLNLGALSPTLMESELFGHERGAFTDAHQARQGCFRRAAGGTICLDDIDLLPLQAQVKLLRVLQERVVEPLGAEGPEPVDVRVVATTNRDLARDVEQGLFREDLYYRLSVMPLTVPPLRARFEDLPALCAILLERLGERLGVPPRVLSPRAQERLASHAWPGNVRELENALERVLVLAGPCGERSGRPIEAQEFDFLGEALEGAAADVARLALSHGLTVADVEGAMMHLALGERRGNISAAARQIGMTRRAFEYRRTRADGDGDPEAPAAEQDRAG